MRLRLGERTALLMDQPQDAEAPTAPANATPDERRALGYNAVARLAGADCERFIATAELSARAWLERARDLCRRSPQRLRADRGFRRHALCRCSVARRRTNTRFMPAPSTRWRSCTQPMRPRACRADKPLHSYDETALIAETDLMTDWFLPLALGRAAHADEIAEHRALWRAALEAGAQCAAGVRASRLSCAESALARRARGRGARRPDRFSGCGGGHEKPTTSFRCLEDARRDVSPELAESMTRRYLAARTGANEERPIARKWR